MATVHWAYDIYGFNFRHIIQNDLASFGTMGGSSTQVSVIGTMDGVVYGWPEFSVVMGDYYYGSFQYGALTDPVSGTINMIERRGSGAPISQVSGLNITYAEAVAVAGTLDREDNAALFAREFAGDDQITTSGARDLLEGFAGNDLLSAGGGNDTLYGGSGLDTLVAGAGDDTLDGGAGVDSLDGGDGNDLQYGGEDNDVLASGNGDDTLDGGAGDDYSVAGLGNDILYGAVGADTLFGDSGNDLLDGGFGLDVLLGGDGNDSLYGQSDRDLLTGGRGADKLYGGAGNDAFIFSSVKDSTVKSNGRDTIYDFSSRQKDKIDLKLVDANTKAKGNQGFKFIDKQDFHKKAGELQWEKVKSGVYVYGDVTGDGRADFSIFLKGLSKISKGDFIL